MAQNSATSEDPFNGGGPKEASSRHQGSVDERCVTFEVPFFLKRTQPQTCYLGSFLLLPEGSSKSILKVSLSSTGKEDFYTPYNSRAPNPTSRVQSNASVNIFPARVVRRPFAEVESLPKNSNQKPGGPSSKVFKKLPYNYYTNAIQHPRIQWEENVLVLFQLGYQCFPFCVETTKHFPMPRVLIDGKSYIFMESPRFWDPPSSNESLTVTVFMENETYTVHLPGFCVQKEIELQISATKYFLILASLTMPSTNSASLSSDTHYFTSGQKDLLMRANSYHEISLREICHAPVFRKDFWSEYDEVKFITQRFEWNKFLPESKTAIQIGSKGTLSFYVGARRRYLGNGLFRLFITEKNDLVALQKFLKVSLKLSLYDK